MRKCRTCYFSAVHWMIALDCISVSIVASFLLSMQTDQRCLSCELLRADTYFRVCDHFSLPLSSHNIEYCCTKIILILFSINCQCDYLVLDPRGLSVALIKQGLGIMAVSFVVITPFVPNCRLFWHFLDS
jgi:hypothetical protein